MLTAGSLFSGIGGMDCAFAAAGFNILFQIEIDPFCQAVLRKHSTYWPDAQIYDDITTIDANELPQVDVLFGGFPCQDISQAGKGAGIRKGTRSGLWYEFRRIIGVLRPRVVLLENVPAILTRDGNIVIGHLAEMGYVGQWGVISASDAGAPHKRERWFCVAYRNSRRWVTSGADKNKDRTTDSSISSRPTMAYATSPRLQKWRPDRQSSRYPKTNSGMGTEPERCGVVVNPVSKRPPTRTTSKLRSARHYKKQYGSTHQRGRNQQQLRFARTGAALGNAGSEGARREQFSTRSGTSNYRGAVKSRICRDVDGLSDWLDFPRWPARPGEEQYDYEPPRVITEKTRNRANRLKALGNAVVPQVIYPIALTIREILKQC